VFVIDLVELAHRPTRSASRTGAGSRARDCTTNDRVSCEDGSSAIPEQETTHIGVPAEHIAWTMLRDSRNDRVGALSERVRTAGRGPG
tara:strand:- start:5124 stop:5387 length:264 start_codon:yes stop_codon:yes gene_type:complete